MSRTGEGGRRSGSGERRRQLVCVAARTLFSLYTDKTTLCPADNSLTPVVEGGERQRQLVCVKALTLFSLYTDRQTTLPLQTILTPVVEGGEAETVGLCEGTDFIQSLHRQDNPVPCRQL